MLRGLSHLTQMTYLCIHQIGKQTVTDVKRGRGSNFVRSTSHRELFFLQLSWLLTPVHEANQLFQASFGIDLPRLKLVYQLETKPARFATYFAKWTSFVRVKVGFSGT
jgi:hypothetical protein